MWTVARDRWGVSGGLGTQRGARGGLVTGALAECSGLVPILHSCFSQSPGIAVKLDYYVQGRGRGREDRVRRGSG